MKRHQSRIVTHNFIKVASAVKDGMTMTYWYYIWVGSKWHTFDIRDIAAKTNHPLPKLATDAEIETARGVTLGYELLLQRDLQTVALWCVAVDAKNYIGV